MKLKNRWPVRGRSVVWQIESIGGGEGWGRGGGDEEPKTAALVVRSLVWKT